MIRAGFVLFHAFLLGSWTLFLPSCKPSSASDPAAPNSPPTASASAEPMAGEAPLNVLFSAAGSSDVEGALSGFSWDFGDGSPAVEGIEADHAFLEAGDFTVTLTVTDGAGARATSTIAVTASPLSCPDFQAGVVAGTIESASIIEASGIAASRRNPGVYWINNDSGDSARIFAAGPTGRHLGTYAISGASARDWEDIVVGPGPDPEKTYIYIADIGDNALTRASVSVYRVPEPAAEPDQAPVAITLSGAVRLDMRYPGGASDAESLMVDPWTGDISIVTKKADGNSKVLLNPAPHVPGVVADMVEVAALRFGSGNLPGGTPATAADISPAGSHIIIKTYSSAFIWLRPYGTSIAEALAGTPCAVPLGSEPAGEAICFSADGAAYLTVSEGSHPPLHRFDRDFPP